MTAADHEFAPLVDLASLNGSDTCRVCHVPLREHETCSVEGCEAGAEVMRAVQIDIPAFGPMEAKAPFCERHKTVVAGNLDDVSVGPSPLNRPA